ncbi:MAG: class I SAM-dependent methyltransferase [Rhodospirillaceae bacterium]|jgi:ubiquinone/menaquinone biosynthesis C-methylase UbiE|nr:class I SAM-dependent methyltransferase [Rhodospirillaceae bacterium]MBT4690205.1 class I SAM-dependent methyltransferase [Rhodospirillaceae bacterium]MBT5525192.1 class I SAM-dependent methyltransferase [Rhodospirillaceae bacterium]MBT5877761.1 class I SAM-dependent methyltransferase [Rhodospirillaceae bacterium]MBT6589255.1 class I SAM-dependent methyltransferase [Rhodospirillaceae bacterium]
MAGQRKYSHIARTYDILDLPFEYLRYRPLRPTIWSGLDECCRILDAGIGTGRNMDYYPAGVEMVGLDLSPAMLARAAVRRRKTGTAVHLVEGNIIATPFADDTFDAVVSTFLFCVLPPDLQLPALRELARICKPEGEIRILEYAISANPIRRAVMKLWAPWIRFAYGAAFDRETEQYLATTGLQLVARRFLHADIIKLLVARQPLVPAPSDSDL